MDKQYPAATSGSRSKLISGNFKKIFNGPGVSHPQKNFTAQLYNAEQEANKSSRKTPRRARRRTNRVHQRPRAVERDSDERRHAEFLCSTKLCLSRQESGRIACHSTASMGDRFHHAYHRKKKDGSTKVSAARLLSASIKESYQTMECHDNLDWLLTSGSAQPTRTHSAGHGSPNIDAGQRQFEKMYLKR